MSEIKQDLRPSPRASEEVWDEYLSTNAIVWAIDLSQYNITTNVSVVTHKDSKGIDVYVEFNGGSETCPKFYINAFVYNAHKRIMGNGNVLCYQKINGFLVGQTAMRINSSISKIDKIVFGGEVD